ncbi:MAG: hypothetical protein WCO13_14525 [Bacteroidota bacterium]
MNNIGLKKLRLQLNRNENNLIKASLPYLKSFINEMNGFYPFAMIMDNNKKIRSISPDVEFEDEYPNSQYLIELYEKGIENEFKKLDSEYDIAILCIDTFLNEKIDNVELKKNAIELRLITSSNRKSIKLIYSIINNEVIFMDWIF